jgi:hypothetical protein
MKLFNKYKFSDKSQALGGLISTAMGILSLLSFGYGVYLSFKAAGEGGLRVGSLGILSLSGNWNSNRTNQLQRR